MHEICRKCALIVKKCEEIALRREKSKEWRFLHAIMSVNKTVAMEGTDLSKKNMHREIP